MTNNEILKIDKDATTRLSQRSVKANAEQPPKPEPEFLDFDPSEVPCITISKTKVVDNKFLFTAGGDDANMFSYEDFVDHDTIIIKSCTGTGKTTATANHYKRLSETSKGLRFLSIVDKISLSEEHVKAFKKINMVSYREAESISKTSASVICVNSLQKLIHITDKEIGELVVYIDEIDSFLKFTHNQTIDNMKPIYLTLKRIVNKCAKLIVSDATILNNLFIFLRNRVPTNSLLLTNSFRKYQGVQAFHHSDEQEFLDCLLANVEKNQGFLYGSDSRKVVESHFELCKDAAPEWMRKEFILITQHNKFRITDATEQFRGKFVFYSPSIVYGVDFNNVGAFQDVFIYISGKSIEPSQSFQQASRTRFISNLHFFGVEKDCSVPHKTLLAVSNNIKHNVHDMPHIKQLFAIANESDVVEYQVKYFMGFYSLYSYNQYINNIYKSNKVRHFKRILATHGFEVVEIGDASNPTKVSKGMLGFMDQLTEARDANLLEEYLHTDDKAQAKFESIHSRAKFLEITAREDLQKYKSILQNVKEFDDHNKIMRYLRTDKYINEKLEKSMKGNFDIATCSNPYLKVKALRTIEQQFDININSGVVNGDDGPIELDDSLFKLARARYSQKKPASKHDVVKFYISSIKHHVSPGIVETSRVSHGENRRKYKYQLNTDLVLQHLVLNSLKNCRLADVTTHYKTIYSDKHGSVDDSDDSDSDVD